MPLYLSSHTIACLTKQAQRELMRELMDAKDVKVKRVLSSQIGGRMILEAEAPGQLELARFFESHLLNVEWAMRIDLDAHDGIITEY